MDISYTFKRTEQFYQTYFEDALSRARPANKLLNSSLLTRAQTITPQKRYRDKPVFRSPEDKIGYMKQILGSLSTISHRINSNLHKTQSMYCQIQNDISTLHPRLNSSIHYHHKKGRSCRLAYNSATNKANKDSSPEANPSKMRYKIKEANYSMCEPKALPEGTLTKKKVVYKASGPTVINKSLFNRRKVILLNYLSKWN
jgi:hypothetical protein